MKIRSENIINQRIRLKVDLIKMIEKISSQGGHDHVVTKSKA